MGSSLAVTCVMVSLTLSVASAAAEYPLMELFACPTVKTAQAQAKMSEANAERPSTIFSADNPSLVTASGCAFSQVAIVTVEPQPWSAINPYVAWTAIVNGSGPSSSFVDFMGRRLRIKTSDGKGEMRFLYGHLTFGDGSTDMGWVEMPKMPYGLVFVQIYKKDPKRAERLIVSSTPLLVPR